MGPSRSEQRIEKNKKQQMQVKKRGPSNPFVNKLLQEHTDRSSASLHTALHVQY